jgi:hypothetical protein
MSGRSIRRSISSSLLLIACVLSFTGCGKSNSVDGTYTMGGGMMAMRLHGGDADIIVAGRSRDAKYQVNGNTITVSWANGRLFSTFTINSDGSLTGSNGGDRWTRQ